MIKKKKDENKEKELCALDEMFCASRRYRSSREYMELLKFISRFRRYAPFNCMLMHIQKPDVTYVATAWDWNREFNRNPKRDARPLVILQPFGPVMFLYDLQDTEGEPVPESVIKPFNTKGTLPKYIFDNTVYNCNVHGIDVRDDLNGLFNAGRAIRLSPTAREHYRDLKLLPHSNYLILLNKNHSVEEKYATLSHELGHIFCGHLGVDKLAWWDANFKASINVIEIEAESVAHLVCQRQGLISTSARYLSAYKTPVDIEMPFFALNAVFQAIDYIEKMGESIWKEPKRKPKKGNGVKSGG